MENKRTIVELSDSLEKLTYDYSEIYFERTGTKKMGEHIFGALHIGFGGALGAMGYTEDYADLVLNRAQKNLEARGFFL